MTTEPRWAALKVHDEQPDETNSGVKIVVVTDSHGPYATERASRLIARGLNESGVDLDGDGAPRWIAVRVEPIDGWTWDGMKSDVMVGGAPVEPGCCSMCKGTGYSGDDATPGGKCWDCQGTGHAHAGPCNRRARRAVKR